MYLSEIFSQLTYGELSQLALSNPEDGTIPETKRRQVASHIDLALKDLHKRFTLKEGRLPLYLIQGQTLYQLQPQEGEPVLNKVERVRVPEGCPLPLNEGGEPFSCFTPAYNRLRLPRALVDVGLQGPGFPAELKGLQQLEVVYRAGPVPLPMTAEDLAEPENLEIDLPDTHLMALLLFVASRVHNPIGMVNEFHSGNSYWAKYEAECARLIHDGLQGEATHEDDRFSAKGFV